MDRTFFKRTLSILSSPTGIVGALAGAISGMCLGNIGPLIDDNNPHSYAARAALSSALITYLAVSFQVGCACGAFISGFFVAPQFGRLFALRAMCFCVLTGGALSTMCAHAVGGTCFFAGACVGRALIGVGNGMACHCTPLYLVETSPRHHRGPVDVLFQITCAISVLLAYTLETQSSMLGGWLGFALPGVPASILLSVLTLAPSRWLHESPRWLHQQGRIEKAREILCALGDDGVVLGEWNPLGDQSGGTVEDVKPKQSLRAVARAGVLIVVQVACGIDILSTYPGTFFSGGEGPLGTICIGTSMVVGSVLTFFIIERVGRKGMLLIGGTLMALSFFAMLLAVKVSSDLLLSATAVVGCFAYNLGWGPVAWLMPNELWSTAARDRASAIFMTGSWCVDAVVVFTFLWLKDSPLIGLGGVGVIYGLINAFAVVFVVVEIRDTTGLVLEDCAAA